MGSSGGVAATLLTTVRMRLFLSPRHAFTPANGAATGTAQGRPQDGRSVVSVVGPIKLTALKNPRRPHWDNVVRTIWVSQAAHYVPAV